MAMSGHERIVVTRRDSVTQSVIKGGAVTASLAGLGAAVLAILALIGYYPVLFAAIATICVGVAFLSEGGAVASRAPHLAADSVDRRDSEMVGGGMALESLAGIAGIVLGILALLGYQPLMLLAIAAIVYGVGMLTESGALARLSTLFRGISSSPARVEQSADPALSTTVGLDVICGLAGIALGVLALLGYWPQMLVQIAMLAFGGVVLLSGAVLASRIGNLLGYRSTGYLRG